jgi:hypothetical protein
LESIDTLRNCAITCFKLKYKRGCVESLNLIVKSCLLVPDIFLLKSVFKLMGFLFIFFNKMKFAVSCFERLRDISDED